MDEEEDDAEDQFSVLDLVSYYEPGPVLKERTPDINRVVFGPEENVYNEPRKNLTAAHPRKSMTNKESLKALLKEALGLTDMPAGRAAGNDVGVQRTHEQEDAEASNKCGFGGESIIDVEEDKPPSNIDRKDKKNVDGSYDDFFDFLMSSGSDNYDSIKKGYYIVDHGKLWMKKSTGSFYNSIIDKSNNITLINVNEKISSREKNLLIQKINTDGAASKIKKEAYKQAILETGSQND